jgi:hypothetical protein
MLPPLKEHRMTDELEPRRELQAGLLEHLFKLLCGNISRVANLVGVNLKVDIGLNEENVVNCGVSPIVRCIFNVCESRKLMAGKGLTLVFPPLPIARGLVMNPG